MTKKITFLAMKEYMGAIPYPAPASEFMPDWFKNMPLKADPEKPSLVQNITPRACPGLQDVMRAGYIIPAWTDFFIDQNRGMFFQASNDEQFLDMFPSTVTSHFPFPEDCHHKIIFKAKTPWKIISDKPVPMLITSPLLRFDERFYSYEGILDIGSNITDLHFMFTPKKELIEVKRGEPLLQLIPLDSDNFVSEVKEFDAEKQTQFKRELKLMKGFSVGGYFKFFHKKRTYK